MTFDLNLKTFNFNNETLSLLREDGLDRESILNTMEEVGFTKDLSNFLLDTKLTFFNSIMIRIKLYAKKNTSLESIKKSFSLFPESLYLVNHLFENNSAENNNSENNSEIATDNTDSQNIQILDDDIIDSDDEEVPLDLFINAHITEKQGSKLSVKESYDVFVNWYTQKYQEEEPDRKAFKKYLSEKLGKGSKSSWKNYALV